MSCTLQTMIQSEWPSTRSEHWQTTWPKLKHISCQHAKQLNLFCVHLYRGKHAWKCVTASIFKKKFCKIFYYLNMSHHRKISSHSSCISVTMDTCRWCCCWCLWTLQSRNFWYFLIPWSLNCVFCDLCFISAEIKLLSGKVVYFCVHHHTHITLP